MASRNLAGSIMSEQLEVRISGRDFGISLKGYNEQAGAEIRELFAHNNTDLLTLLRAYLDVVHKKCELESKIQEVDSRIDLSMQRHALLASAQNTLDDSPLDSSKPSDELATNLKSTFIQEEQHTPNLFDPLLQQQESPLTQQDTTA